MTEAQTCRLWLNHSNVSSNATLMGGAFIDSEFVNEGERVHVLPGPFHSFFLLFKIKLNKIFIIADVFAYIKMCKKNKDLTGT